MQSDCPNAESDKSPSDRNITCILMFPQGHVVLAHCLTAVTVKILVHVHSASYLAQRAEGLGLVRRRGAPLAGVPRRPPCSQSHVYMLSLHHSKTVRSDD